MVCSVAGFLIYLLFSMLSIVICSGYPHFLAQLKENLASTIGVPYELLVWDNSKQTKKSLCEAYNLLAAQSQYPLLCILHDDILFETMNWGRQLVNIFSQNEDIGVVGLAGGKYKSRLFSGWYCGHSSLDCMNITHRTNGHDDSLYLPADNKQPYQEVISIDGVFMACRKEIWERTRFDENSLKGFHYYDIDFSLRASWLAKVVVWMDVRVVHLSSGKYGDEWVKATIAYHEKRKEQLPKGVKDLPVQEPEKLVAKAWLDRLKTEPISFHYKRQWILKQGLYKSPGNWYGIFKFLFYQPLGLKKIHRLLKKG